MGGKVHTIEDQTVSRLHPATEGLYFASLKGVVRECGSRTKLRRGYEPN